MIIRTGPRFFLDPNSTLPLPEPLRSALPTSQTSLFQGSNAVDVETRELQGSRALGGLPG